MRSATDPIIDWLSYCKLYYESTTCERYRQAIYAVNNFLQKLGKNLQTASTSGLQAYLAFYSDNGRIKARSVNAHLTAIKSYYRWYSAQTGRKNPARKIRKLLEQPPKQRCLSTKEYETVLQYADDVERDVIQFLGNTGLRTAEFVALQETQIDKELKYLQIIGKYSKRRIVPINAVVRQIVIENPHLPFVAPYTRKGSLNNLCKKLSRHANIPRFGPHACRHFFATRLIQAGVPLIIVSRILGHANTQTTEKIYCHLAPTDVLGATDRLAF